MEMQPAAALANDRVALHSQASDEELVVRANNGQWSGFEALVRRYQEPFHRLAWSYVKTDADAQDVVQTAFVKMYRNLQTFRGEASFKSWAYRIVVNTALSRIRRHKRQREVALEGICPSVDELEQLQTSQVQQGLGWSSTCWQARGDEIVENHELRRLIIDAVDQLEPKYQTVFLLHEVEGLEIVEIGEVIGLSVPGVKSRLHRARLFLRATLQRCLQEYAPELVESEVESEVKSVVK